MIQTFLCIISQITLLTINLDLALLPLQPPRYGVPRVSDAGMRSVFTLQSPRRG